jgi:hypothetical protein
MEFGYVNQNENFEKWIFYNKYCASLIRDEWDEIKKFYLLVLFNYKY